MKYIIVLGDGMADIPISSIDNKTPLEVANKETIDSLAKYSILGMAKTVPDKYNPGSDVANLSAMGYDPCVYYTGRSPLEALSIGINMKNTDIAIRTNLVTLSDEDNYEEKTMLDYSAGEISTEEATKLIEAVESELGNDAFCFYPGISYRHCLIWNMGKTNLSLTPPHDISDKPIKNFLPEKTELLELMKKSYNILKNHPINIDRIKRGLNPANSIWLWGEGTKPILEPFNKKFGLKGSVISAVDLIKGIGIGAEMNIIEVEGATGTIHTNFKGKCDAAIKTLLKDNYDFLYLHCEAPDECGHHGNLEEKILSIEKIDSEIVKPLIVALNEAKEDFSLLFMPDHPTPISTKTHSRDPIPFMLYRSYKHVDSNQNKYTEKSCKESKIFVDEAHTLIEYLINDKLDWRQNV